MQTIKFRVKHQSGAISYLDAYIKLPQPDTKLSQLIINSINNAGLIDKLIEAKPLIEQ